MLKLSYVASLLRGMFAELSVKLQNPRTVGQLLSMASVLKRKLDSLPVVFVYCKKVDKIKKENYFQNFNCILNYKLDNLNTDTTGCSNSKVVTKTHQKCFRNGFQTQSI